MNYLLHNLGYDKPVNFRYIVLTTYKNHCMWLRDSYIDRLGLYDYTKWIPDIEYEKRMFKMEKEQYKKTKEELASLTDEKLQKLYEQEVDKVKSLNECNNSYHSDIVADIKSCIGAYSESLQKWIETSNAPLWLNTELVDIYDTAVKDMEEHERENIKSIERMHNEPIPTFEDFKRRIVERLEWSVERNKDQVAARRRCIKIVERQIEEVKQLFAWLDTIEKKENA